MTSAHRKPGPVGQRLIEHALTTRSSDLPDSARRAAAMFIEDTLLVGLAGYAVPERSRLLQTVSAWGQGEAARAWGGAEPLPAPTAALINGYQIHAQEYDCVHEPAVVHPMAVIGASLFAFAEANGPVRGSDLNDAVIVAVDCATTLGMMATRPMRFFRPAQCGAIGATLGLCRLAGMDRHATAVALGLTGCQLSGTMQAHVEGTAGLALQIGVNARNALCAVDLALAGLRGPIDAIDGPYGYLALIEEDFDASALDRLGRECQIEQVSHKPWPTGRAAHGALGALEALLADGLVANQVERISLAAPPLIRRLIDRPFRADMGPHYARLCLPWLLSVTLARGRVGLDDFSPAALTDPGRAAFVDRIKVEASDSGDPNALTPQVLRVSTVHGETIEQPIMHLFGSPAKPMNQSARQAKASSCASFAGLDQARVQTLIDTIDRLDQLDDVGHLIDLMERS